MVPQWTQLNKAFRDAMVPKKYLCFSPRGATMRFSRAMVSDNVLYPFNLIFWFAVKLGGRG